MLAQSSGSIISKHRRNNKLVGFPRGDVALKGSGANNIINKIEVRP